MAKDVKKLLPEYIIGQEKTVLDGDVKITIKTFGVTSIYIDDGKHSILFDAMVTRPSALHTFIGKIDQNKELVKTLIKENHMENLNAVFVSHSHYDHILDMPAFAQETGALVYGTKSTLQVARGNGIPEKKLVEFSGGEVYQIGDFSIRVIKALHSPAKWYNDDLGKEIKEPLTYPVSRRKLTEGGSFDFYIVHGNQKILIRPSCNYIPHTFDDIQADVLFFGVGQMSKMDDTRMEKLYHETIEKIRPQAVIPIHWDMMMLPIQKSDYAFSVMDHPVQAMKYLIKKLEKDGIRFEILLSSKP